MKIVWFDTETELISAEKPAPPLVCMQYQISGEPVRIVDHIEARAVFKRCLDERMFFVGHELSYDTCVMAKEYPEFLEPIFEAYEDNRMVCTLLREQLSDIAKGHFRGKMLSDDTWIKYRYNLADLSLRLLGLELDKDQDVRLTFGPLRGTPISTWPKKHLEYAAEDVEATRGIYLAQEADFVSPNQFAQSKFAFAARLSSNHGICTDPEGVKTFRSAIEDEYLKLKEELRKLGLVRRRGNKDVRDTKLAQKYMAQACEKLAVRPVLTEKGSISLAGDVCERIDDPIIKDYSNFLTLGKVLSNDIKVVEAGTVYPLHPRYDLADTGRTTCGKPNIQNLNRKTGIREAFVPREGHTFGQADYEGLELATLAQACMMLFGHSKLADSLNAGIDVHTEFAANLLGISYAEALVRKANKKDKELDSMRQTAKVAGFGFPGGLGADKLVKFAKKGYGVTMSELDARRLRIRWLNQWPEMAKYFDYIGKATRNGGRCDIMQLFSNRARGNVHFTAACNTLFQGLGADVAKHATWKVTQECYLERNSPLYNSRIVAFIHDEIIVEIPLTSDVDAATRKLGVVMIAAAKEFLPDVAIRTEPLLMNRWSKNAKPVYVDGKLVPWTGK